MLSPDLSPTVQLPRQAALVPLVIVSTQIYHWHFVSALAKALSPLLIVFSDVCVSLWPLMLVTACQAQAFRVPCLSLGWDVTFFPYLACLHFTLFLAHPAPPCPVSSTQLRSLQTSPAPASPTFLFSAIPQLLMNSSSDVFISVSYKVQNVYDFYPSGNNSWEKRTCFRFLCKNSHATHCSPGC